MKKIPPTDNDLGEFSRLSRKIKLFTLMKMDLLEKIMAWVMIYEYKKGEKICNQGEKGDCCYIVYEGSLSVQRKKGSTGFTEQKPTRKKQARGFATRRRNKSWRKPENEPNTWCSGYPPEIKNQC